jgi:hypothetical protein
VISQHHRGALNRLNVGKLVKCVRYDGDQQARPDMVRLIALRPLVT